MEQYEEMQKARKRFWRVLLPLIIYLAVRYFANVAAEVAVLATNISKVLDLQSISGMDMSQQMDYIAQLSRDATTIAKFTKLLIENSTLLSTIVAVISLPVGIVFFIIDRRQEKASQIPRIQKQPVWKYPLMLLLGYVLCVGLNVILIMCDQAFFDGSSSQALSATYAAPIVLQIIGIGILVPLSEEFFYRGVLYNRYRENSTWVRAAVYSGILFALGHGTIIQMLYALILGIALAFAYEKFGSIAAPIFVHIAVNVTSVLITNVNGFAWLLAKPLRAGIAAILCAFVGSSALVYLQSLTGRDYLREESSGTDTGKEV